MGQGTVHHQTFPRLEDFLPEGKTTFGTRDKSTEFEARLASLIISAVRHVFLPDINFEQAEPVDKVRTIFFLQSF